METLVVLIDLHCDASMPSGLEEFGGGNMYTRNLIKCLLKTHIPFVYITRKKFSYLESKIRMSSNSEFYRIDIGNFSYNDKDILQYHIEIAIEKTDRILQSYKKRFQFVFHSFYWQSGILGKYFAEKYNTYFVHSILSNAERKQKEGAVSDIVKGRIHWEHVIFESAKYIICSSESERKDMIKLYHLPSEKLFVTGRWIADSYLNPVYQQNGKTRTHLITPVFPIHYLKSSYPSKNENTVFWQAKSFIYFGRIHENKGVPQIIEAWQKLYAEYRHKMPALWIIGGSPEQIEDFHEKFLSKNELIQSAETEGKIIWWGSLAPEGISTLLLKSLAFIMHSRYEAGGITVIEAMSQAVPVIATPYGFANDYIRHGYNGYLVDFNNVCALMQHMNYFINQPYLSNYLGRQAKLAVSSGQNNLDFLSAHIKLYGLSEKELESEKQFFLQTDYIYKNSVDIFPYSFEMPAKEFIRYISAESLTIPILSIELCPDSGQTYVKWIITAHSHTYYFYYLYHLLNESRIESGKGPYVISSAERIKKFIEQQPENACNYYLNQEKGFILTSQRMDNYI